MYLSLHTYLSACEHARGGIGMLGLLNCCASGVQPGPAMMLWRQLTPVKAGSEPTSTVSKRSIASMLKVKSRLTSRTE